MLSAGKESTDKTNYCEGSAELQTGQWTSHTLITDGGYTPDIILLNHGELIRWQYVIYTPDIIFLEAIHSDIILLGVIHQKSSNLGLYTRYNLTKGKGYKPDIILLGVKHQIWSY